jgi:hypothetical protein
MKLLYTLLFAFFISCSTEPEDVYGCTVQTACNFNSNATIFDDSCDYDTCADECGVPNGDNGTCVDLCGVPNGDNATCSGCIDETAYNYDVNATNDDGSCSYGISGTVRDEAGNPIPDAAILLTYTYGLDELDRNRPSTSINYSLASEGLVQIWIEEICGDTVIVLVDEVQPSGYHSVIWNADDTNGDKIVDGVYIIKMKAGSSESENYLTLMVEDYSHLDSIEGQNYHAMTDENGVFKIPMDCLPFGDEYMQMQTDAEGNELGVMSLQYKVKIWVIHTDHDPYSTDFIDVDPQLGVNKEITLP